MKKLALLIAILTIFTSTAFAQIDVTVTGKSVLTFGIALDSDIATGLKNANESKISFNLADGSSEKGGEADVYGWIEIKEWKAEVNSSDGYKTLDAGDVTAKIMFNGGWLKISGTNTSIDLAEPVFYATGTADGIEENVDDYKGIKPAITGAGFVLGLDMAPAAIEVGISSPQTWEENANSANTYGAHVKATIDMAPITLTIAGVTDINPTEVYGMGVEIAADLATLTLNLASDIVLSNDPIDYEVVLELGVNLGEEINLAVSGSYSSIDNIDFDADLDVSIDAIGLGIYALVTDVDTDDLRYVVEFDASYTTDTLKPYLAISYGSISAVDDDNRTLQAEDSLGVTVGVESYAIENVTLKGEWSADPLADTNGNLIFSATIAY